VHLAHLTAQLGIASALSATAPTAADLARCADLPAPDARLACYDALAEVTADHKPAAAPAASTAASPPANPEAATAAAPPAAVGATPAAPGIASAPAPTSTFASDPRNFGFTETQLEQTRPHSAQTAPTGPTAIQARIDRIIDVRYGHCVAVLDNGQTWTFVDADLDSALRSGDQVTIRRASLGSFLMITPSKHSYHVRRTQ
jgi:hypothetical protein